MPRGVVSGLPARGCALSGCNVIFTPRRRDQRFCTTAHRLRAHEDVRFCDRLQREVASGRLHILLSQRSTPARARAIQVRLL